MTTAAKFKATDTQATLPIEFLDIVRDLWAYAADAQDPHLRDLADRARAAVSKIEA